MGMPYQHGICGSGGSPIDSPEQALTTALRTAMLNRALPVGQNETTGFAAERHSE